MILQALRRWWPLAAVVTLLFAISVAAAHATPQLDRIPKANGPAETVQTPAAEKIPGNSAHPPDAAGGIGIPDWLPVLLGAILLLLVAVAVALALWTLLGRLLRREWDDGVVQQTGAAAGVADAEILAAVEAGLAELSDTDTDPRRAVIGCWVRLEETAGAAGVPRHDTDTPTDLVIRLLAGAEPARGRVVSADVLAQLADVYREARYARHRIDEQTRDQARTALDRLRAELTGAVPR